MLSFLWQSSSTGHAVVSHWWCCCPVVCDDVQMAKMAGRIAGVRSELQAALEKRCPDKDWSFVTQQIGMFSFTGMTPQQVRHIVGCWWGDTGAVRKQLLAH